MILDNLHFKTIVNGIETSKGAWNLNKSVEFSNVTKLCQYLVPNLIFYVFISYYERNARLHRVNIYNDSMSLILN